MRNRKIRVIVSSIGLFSILFTATAAKAAPVRFNQVVQVVNPKPSKAVTGNYTQLHFSDDKTSSAASVGDDTNKPAAPAQDGRVIVTTTSDIVLDEACDCVQSYIAQKPGIGFPKWALLGLAAVPAAFLIANNNDNNAVATPTPVITPTVPGQTPTPATPTPTAPITPTPTDTPVVTPTPEPVPEPMTILLFGTGLAGIGVAARKRLRRKSDE